MRTRLVAALTTVVCLFGGVAFAADPVPPAQAPASGPTNFVPDMDIWAKFFGPWLSAAAGALLWILSIALIAGIIVYVLARRGHNPVWAKGGAFSVGIALLGFAIYGGISTGLLQSAATLAGRKLSAVLNEIASRAAS